MSQIDLVYTNVPCPICNSKFSRILLWFVASDIDEDGHSNGVDVDKVICQNCGELFDVEAERVVASVIDDYYHKDDVGCESMMEIGKIYEHIPKTNSEVSSTKTT